VSLSVAFAAMALEWVPKHNNAIEISDLVIINAVLFSNACSSASAVVLGHFYYVMWAGPQPTSFFVIDSFTELLLKRFYG
jgi:hypothetical protein